MNFLTAQIEFFKKAINTLDHLTDTDESKREQIDIRLLMAISMTTLSFPEDFLTILREGERLSKEVGDEKNLAIFYRSLSYYYSLKEDPLLGIKYTADSFREVEKIQDIELMAPMSVTLYTPHVWTGDYSKVTETAPNLIHLLEKTKRESDFFENPYSSPSATVDYEPFGYSDYQTNYKYSIYATYGGAEPPAEDLVGVYESVWDDE